MSDLVIGMAANYEWTDLYPFVVSLRRSGYTGKCILLTNAAIPDKYKVQTIPLKSVGATCIVDRFRLIPIYITGVYRYVIACDTSDIVFQSNPVKWLEAHLGKNDLCAVSEGVTFADSPGNKKNMIEAFGEETYEWMKDREVLNAGFIAGRPAAVSGLLGAIYDLCQIDKRKNVSGVKWDDMFPDQSALNILGRIVMQVKESDRFVREYNHTAPKEEFVVLHQYLMQWKDEIRERYKE